MTSHNRNAVCRPPPNFGNWSSIAAERHRRLKHDIVAKRNLAQLQITLPDQLLLSLVNSFGDGSCVVDERNQCRNDQQCSYPIAHLSLSADLPSLSFAPSCLCCYSCLPAFLIKTTTVQKTSRRIGPHASGPPPPPKDEDFYWKAGPSDAELSTPGNWVKVYFDKNIRIVAIRHNI